MTVRWLGLVLVLATGCGTRPLSDVSGGKLSLGLKRVGAVTDVALALEAVDAGCPKLDATATLNDVPLRVVDLADRPEVTPSTYYFLPTPGCRGASFVYSTDAGAPVIAGDQPLSLVVKDQQLTLSLTSADVLVVAPQLEPATTRHVRDTLVFTLNRPVQTVINAALTLRPAGETTPIEVWGASINPDSITNPLPAAIGPGTYHWAMTVVVVLPPDSCSGLATCQLFVSTTGEGELTLVP